MDTATIESKRYSPPVLNIPMPSGVTPDMVDDSMIACGSSEYAAAGLACVSANTTAFQGATKRTCFHEDNTDAAESAWAALVYPETIGMRELRSRKILTLYIMTITFPFPRQSPPPPLAPILAALSVLSLCCIGAAGAGNAAANALKRRHQPTWQA